MAMFIIRRSLQCGIKQLTTSSGNKVRRMPRQIHTSSAYLTSIPSSEPAERKDDLIITDACIKRLREMGEEGKKLRVTVEGGGCSGFQYKFSLDDKIGSEDRIFAKDGVEVIIDEDSLSFVKGSTVDYEEELIRSAFTISGNPQAEQGCSCGASFSLKL